VFAIKRWRQIEFIYITESNTSWNFSTVFAGQAVGISEVHDDIWLVSFMDYDLGYFDLETRVLEPLENPFGAKVLPMSPGRTPNQNSAPEGTILELFSSNL